MRYQRNVMWISIMLMVGLSTLTAFESDTAKVSGGYTFIQAKPSADVPATSRIKVPDYHFISKQDLNKIARSNRFDPSKMYAGTYSLRLSDQLVPSILPPVRNDNGDILTLRVPRPDTLEVDTWPKDELQAVQFAPTKKQRFESLALMSMLPVILPAFQLAEESEELFAYFFMLAYVYGPVGAASLGFYPSQADLEYPGDSFFNVAGDFGTVLNISASYMPNIMFRHYYNEYDFRLVPVVGGNLRLLHRLSPAQANLGIYYASDESQDSPLVENHRDVGANKYRIMMNTGVVYPLSYSDRIRIDLETGITSTFDELMAPYVRINWSPRIAGNYMFGISHHLLFATGVDWDSNVSGWPLLHTINITPLSPVNYRLINNDPSSWHLSAGLQTIPGLYYLYRDQQEFLPALILSRQVSQRHRISFATGIGSEHTSVDSTDHSDWYRETEKRTHQLFFTDFTASRIYVYDRVNVAVGGGIRYITEFYLLEGSRFYYHDWELRTWTEDRDRSSLMLLFTTRGITHISPWLSLTAGVDVNILGIFDMIDNADAIKRTLMGSISLEVDLNKFGEDK